MIKEIQQLNDLIFKELNLQLSEINPDLECEEYSGYNFKIMKPILNSESQN